MRRLLVSALIITALLVTGCAQASVPAGSNAATTETIATQGPTGATTYQAVLLGRGDEPVVPADVAPRLFRDEPSVAAALEITIPADIAARSPGIGEHLIVALFVVGATETPQGVEVYADLREEWFSLEGEQAVEFGGATYPVRIRLTKDGGTFRVDGVDRPRDGSEYLSSLDEMFPDWARSLVDTEEAADLMRQAIRVAALEWAAPYGVVTVALPTTTTNTP
jgi:hypothetical protein